MGWLFSSSWSDRETLRDHLVNGNGLKHLKSCWKGNNLWAVCEYTYPENHQERPGLTIQFVALYLCAKHGKGMDGWGYKDMDESAGPCYYTCPISYIEQVEAHEKANGYGPHAYAAEWRASVREVVAKRRRKLAVGDKIKLYGHEYTIGKCLGRRGYLIQNSMYDYRMKLNQVKDVEVLQHG